LAAFDAAVRHETAGAALPADNDIRAVTRIGLSIPQASSVCVAALSLVGRLNITQAVRATRRNDAVRCGHDHRDPDYPPNSFHRLIPPFLVFVRMIKARRQTL
jgi:hypothetical protein